MSRAITVAPDRVDAGADTLGLSVQEVDPGRWEITVMVIRAWRPDATMVQEGAVTVTLLDAHATTLAEARPAPGIVQAGGAISTTTSVRFQAAIGDAPVAAIAVGYAGHTARFAVED